MLGLLEARARAAASTLAAIAVVAFVAVISLGFTIGSVESGVVRGSETILADASAQSAALRITTHLADDPAAQDAAAQHVLSRLFPAGSMLVYPARHSLATNVSDAEGEPTSRKIVFGVEPAFLDHAAIVDGSWPSNNVGNAVALQADAARDMGLEVGDDFTVGSRSDLTFATVAALWVADDPTDPIWFADSLAGAGRSNGASGIAVMRADEFGQLPTQLFATWTLVARPSAVHPGLDETIAAGFRHLPDAVESNIHFLDVSASFEGTLPSKLITIASAARGAHAIAASAVCIVALLLIVALLQLCSVLVGSRRRQTLLLKARGLSLVQLAAMNFVEAVAVAAPAAAAGTAVVALLVGIDGSVIISSVVTVGVIGLCSAGVAMWAHRPRPSAVIARGTMTPFLVGAGLVTIAATIATWQLYSTASAAPGAVDSTSPALVLVAGASAGSALLIPAARCAARLPTSTKSVATVLSARQIGRRTANYLVPVLALAIATASGFLASGMATTWTETQTEAQLVGTGPAVAVTLGVAKDSTLSSVRFAQLKGVKRTAALLTSTATVGSDVIPFVAVRPDSAAAVLAPGADEAVRALRTTSPDGLGVAVASNATRISVTVESEGDGGSPTSTFQFAIWVADSDGALALIPLSEDAGTKAWSGLLPQTVSRWHLMAVEATRTGSPDASQSDFSFNRFSDDISGELEPGLSVAIDAMTPLPTARVLLSVAPAEAHAPLPIVLTEALSARIGSKVGDPITLKIATGNVLVQGLVTAVTGTLPGAGSLLAIGTDLAAFDRIALASGASTVEANSVWLDSTDVDSAVEQVSRTSTETAIVRSDASTTTTPVVAAALNAFWVAAGTAAALAIIALFAFVIDDFRDRRSDATALRALGLATRDQIRVRLNEQAVILVSSLVVGIAGGAVALVVTVGPLLASAAPDATGLVIVRPALDLPQLLGYCIALTAAAGLVALFTVVVVRHTVLTPDAERLT
jgi:hypothetical protein